MSREMTSIVACRSNDGVALAAGCWKPCPLPGVVSLMGEGEREKKEDWALGLKWRPGAEVARLGLMAAVFDRSVGT